MLEPAIYGLLVHTLYVSTNQIRSLPSGDRQNLLKACEQPDLLQHVCRLVHFYVCTVRA